MDRYSLRICGKYFQLILKFEQNVDGYILADVVKERVLMPSVNRIQESSLINRSEIYIERNVRNVLLEYLCTNKIGDFSYLEVNFDSIKILTKDKEKIFKFNILKYLDDEKILTFIKANKLDKNLIISTLNKAPLIPQKYIDIIFNNILLEGILSDFKKHCSTLEISNKLILSGEMIWVNWIADIGKIIIMKNLLIKENFTIYTDSNAVWKAILEERKHNSYLYKLSKRIFIPDILFINTIIVKENKKIMLESYNKEIILSDGKFVNYFQNTDEKPIPKTIIINNIEKKTISQCKQREVIMDYFKDIKHVVNMGLLTKISYKTNESIIIDYGLGVDSLVKNKQNIEEGDLIGCSQKKSNRVQSVINKFYSNSVQGQLVHIGDVIGYEKDVVGKREVRAEFSGKVNINYSKYGLIIFEDTYSKHKIFSPCSGSCISNSNMDGYKFKTNYIEMSLEYQIGNNTVGILNKNYPNDQNNLLIIRELSWENLPIKHIIENNIKLVIVEQFDEGFFMEYLKKYPFILNYASFAGINDFTEGIDLRVRNLLKEPFIKSVILDSGYLKICSRSNDKEFNLLKSQYNSSSDDIVKRIQYKQDKKYGIIIKSQNSTEKVIKYDTEAVIELVSNLINLKYKL